MVLSRQASNNTGSKSPTLKIEINWLLHTDTGKEPTFRSESRGENKNKILTNKKTGPYFSLCWSDRAVGCSCSNVASTAIAPWLTTAT